MNSKYSISRFATGTLAAVAALMSTTACHDDFGYQNEAGQRIAFKLTAAEAWHNGMSVNENAPTTRCTSVQELSGDGDTQLYLHTVVADNPVAEPALTSRGTPITSPDAFKKKYLLFSLSGIYSAGESLYDLPYETATGTPWNMSSGHQLLTPASGSLSVYGFAPTKDAFDKLKTDGSLSLNESDAPTLTYIVPTDVTKQVDLMTAYASPVSSSSQELIFKHALTAVQIKCGTDMLAGKITEVTISGIYGTGSLKIGSENETIGLDWKTSTPTTYTISKKIDLPASTDENVADKIHVAGETQIIGKEGDNLTFLLLPQKLPEGAAMTIKFTDAATKTPRTLTGSIAGQTWEAGKIVTYSISPSSIHISAKVELTKNADDDIMPYSGVWYDAYTAKAEIVQADDTKATDIDIPAKYVKFQYQLDGDTEWKESAYESNKDINGLLTIAPQPAYVTMSSGFKSGETGTETPTDLTKEYGGETANCYLVDQAGYYSLPLVYGNCIGSVPDGNTNALNYYPSYDDNKPITAGTIPGASDAVLCWQDSPDLIDPKSVGLDENKKNLVFHIRKETLAQGNALLAVRNASKQIIWSWHIWVTPYKSAFYSDFYTSSADGYSYKLAAKYNLGWCDKHDHNPSRKFKLRAVVDMSAYGGNKEKPVEVEIGTFTQDLFKGSDAGDNTYYQWGRKDPMLGGVYNTHTPKYTYNNKGVSTTWDKYEFTMENKQVFNQYKECDEAGNVVYDYSFCKNPGDKIDEKDPASKGVSIGYSIQHPYMFITNSRLSSKADGGDEAHNPEFNYRNHWHIPYAENNGKVPYLSKETHIMFNAWNAGATDAGYDYKEIYLSSGTDRTKLKHNAGDVTKSVYDPCPPKFKIPPMHALYGIQQAKITTPLSPNVSYSSSDNKWTMTTTGGSIEFPLTGVRDYALRSNEWTTVKPSGATDAEFDYVSFYKKSMPAFSIVSFLSSATIVKKEDYNAYQVYILLIDRSTRSSLPGVSNLKMTYTPSSNSYGLAVRPMYCGTE